MATRYWKSTSSGSANDASKWNTQADGLGADGVPTSADTARFQQGGDCTWDIASVYSLYLRTEYAGTVTISTATACGATSGDSILINGGTLVLGANISTSANVSISGGTLTGNTSYTLTCAGDFTQSGTGAITADVLKLVMSGNKILSALNGLTLLSLTLNGNTTITHTAGTNGINAYNIVIASGIIVTISTSNLLVLFDPTTFTNAGTITGAGTFRIRLKTADKAYTLGTINAPVSLEASSSATDVRILTLDANAVLGSSLDIVSIHATRTITLATSTYTLTCGAITLGTRGCLSQTGTGGNISCTSFTQSGASSVLTGKVDATFTCSGDFSSSTGTITANVLKLLLTSANGTFYTQSQVTVKYLEIPLGAHITKTIAGICIYPASGNMTIAGRLTLSTGCAIYDYATLNAVITGTLDGNAGWTWANPNGDAPDLTAATIAVPITVYSEGSAYTCTLKHNLTTTNIITVLSGGANAITLSVGTKILTCTTLTLDTRGLLTGGVGGTVIGNIECKGAGNTIGSITINGNLLVSAQDTTLSGNLSCVDFTQTGGTFTGSATYWFSVYGNVNTTIAFGTQMMLRMMTAGTTITTATGSNITRLDLAPATGTITLLHSLYLQDNGAGGHLSGNGCTIDIGAYLLLLMSRDTGCITGSGTITGTTGTLWLDAYTTWTYNQANWVIDAKMGIQSWGAGNSTPTLGANLTCSKTLYIGAGGAGNQYLYLGGYNINCTGVLTADTRAIISGTGTVTCGGFTQSGASSSVTMGGNWTVSGVSNITAGTFAGGDTYYLTTTGLTATASFSGVNIINTGGTLTITNSQAARTIRFTGNSTTVTVLTWGLRIDAGIVIDSTGVITHRLFYSETHAQMENYGTITSGGGSYNAVGYNQDVTKNCRFGTILCPTGFFEYASAGRDSIATMADNAIFGAVTIQSGHTTRPISLDTNGKSLTATSITLGQAGTYGAGVIFLNGGTVTSAITIGANGLLTQTGTAVDTTIVGNITSQVAGGIIGNGHWIILDGNLTAPLFVRYADNVWLKMIGTAKTIELQWSDNLRKLEVTGTVTMAGGGTYFGISEALTLTTGYFTIPSGRYLGIDANNASFAMNIADYHLDGAGELQFSDWQGLAFSLARLVTVCGVYFYKSNYSSATSKTITLLDVLTCGALKIDSREVTTMKMILALNGKTLTATSITCGYAGTVAGGQITVGTGAIITTGNISIIANGVIDGGSGVITCGGNLDWSAGAFTMGSSTVRMTTTGTTIKSNALYAGRLCNLTIAPGITVTVIALLYMEGVISGGVGSIITLNVALVNYLWLTNARFAGQGTINGVASLTLRNPQSTCSINTLGWILDCATIMDSVGANAVNNLTANLTVKTLEIKSGTTAMTVNFGAMTIIATGITTTAGATAATLNLQTANLIIASLNTSSGTLDSGTALIEMRGTGTLTLASGQNIYKLNLNGFTTLGSNVTVSGILRYNKPNSLVLNGYTITYAGNVGLGILYSYTKNYNSTMLSEM